MIRIIQQLKKWTFLAGSLTFQHTCWDLIMKTPGSRRINAQRGPLNENVSVRFVLLKWQESGTGRPGLLLGCCSCWRHTCWSGRSWDRWTLLNSEETQWMREGAGEPEERNTLGLRFQHQDPPVPRHVEERGLQPCKDQQVSFQWEASVSVWCFFFTSLAVSTPEVSPCVP